MGPPNKYKAQKKEPKPAPKMLDLPDLNIRSVLNVVEENFEKLGLKAYAIRMIYIGEHTLPKEQIIKHFSKTISLVNSMYCEIPVHGLLLVYDSYFVHIVEGSEDTIHRHLRFLFKREADWIAEMEKKDQEVIIEEPEDGLTVLMAEKTEPLPERIMFRRLKTVMTYHSIRTLQFKHWRVLTARPPLLVGKLDVYGPLQEHMEHLGIFLNKMAKLCEYANAEEKLSFEGLKVTDPKMEALPEVALIDFLLQSQYMVPVRETAALHRCVSDHIFFFEQAWPVPTHYTPRCLYKVKIDDSFVEPLPVMPWEIVTKEREGDEEEKEERDDADDSSSD